LEENIQQLGTVESVKRIAQEELGLVDPDTVFYNITNQE
jgi:cell division protein FtsB